MKSKWYWLLLIIPCLPVLLAGNRFIVPAGTTVSDILITHYPNLLFIQRSLLARNGIPLWSPQLFGGYPFSANPLSTLWYPPAWLALIFPLPLGINLVMVLHILAGCAGMRYLLRNLHVDESLAWLGAVLYGLLPAGYSHIAGGHFTWVCASAWLPWLLAIPHSGKGTSAGKSILSGAAIGLMMLADLRFAAYGLIIWLLQGGFLILAAGQTTFPAKLKQIRWIALSLLIGIGISTVVWLPLIQFTALSTRSLLTSADTFFLSLPFVQTIGFLVPAHPSTIEWVIYLGVGLVIPGLYSSLIIQKPPQLKFWWLISILCLMWAFGDGLVVNQWLAKIPGVDMMRVPARGIFFLSVSLLLISMLALNDLQTRIFAKLKFFRLGILAILVFALMLQIGFFLGNEKKQSVLIWHAILAVSMAVSVLVYTYRDIPKSWFMSIFSLLLICDFGLANAGLTGYRTVPQALAEGADEAGYLASQGSNYRVFSPSYSLPQQTATFSRIELVDGIDPLQLTGYVNFVNNATGLAADGYSVTLPAFATGNPKTDAIAVQPDAESLGLFNTRYLVSAFPITVSDWKLEKTTAQNYIYSSTSARGWAWVEPPGNKSNEAYLPVQSITRYNNEIDIIAQGPGTLVLSEVDYPGWQAWVDGQNVPIQTSYSILRSIEIAEGTHAIQFKYLPFPVFAGLGISFLTILLCAGTLWTSGKK